MKTFNLLALLLLLLTAAACEKKDADVNCEVAFDEGMRFFEFGHRGSDYTFYAWTKDTAVIAHVTAQLALPEAERGQHINGKIELLPEGCTLNKSWSWYFLADEWDLADISIELCDGNPQYVEDHLEDYLDIERYCPWSSYVLREVTDPF